LTLPNDTYQVNTPIYTKKQKIIRAVFVLDKSVEKNKNSEVAHDTHHEGEHLEQN
jgi:hypothetical protein